MSKAQMQSISDPADASGAGLAFNLDHWRRAGDPAPFLGLIDAVIVDEPAQFIFAGSIMRAHAQAAWVWAVRDLCPDLLGTGADCSAEALDQIMPEILDRADDALADAHANPAAMRRLTGQLGGFDGLQRLPSVLLALKSRALLKKAQAFGVAANAIVDDGALSVAFLSMPLKDQPLSAMLLHAAMDKITNPSHAIAAITTMTGGNGETAITAAGLAPLVEAVLAHAQNQLHLLRPAGAFADIDLTCKAIDRFHRLVRAVVGNVELTRSGRWSHLVAELIKQISVRIEPRLNDIVPDINQSLRVTRGGFDRLDPDRLLSALNGMYLLVTVRDCKDSLALNAAFEQVWSQAGQALELHLNRNLDMARIDLNDANAAARLDAGIKMAHLRYGAEYAQAMRRTRESMDRRRT